jgi:hypothetical protein
VKNFIERVFALFHLFCFSLTLYLLVFCCRWGSYTLIIVIIYFPWKKILNQFKIFNCLLATSSIFQVYAEKVTSEDGNGQGALHARKKMEASLLLSRDQLGVHGTQYDNTMILILLLAFIFSVISEFLLEETLPS